LLLDREGGVGGLGGVPLDERAEDTVRHDAREELPPVLVLSLGYVLGGVTGGLEGRRVCVHAVAEAEDVDRDEPVGRATSAPTWK
jgi:hypothetical protein